MYRTSLWLLLLMLVFATGCPDRSHLRPVPDYENMTDTGEAPVK